MAGDCMEVPHGTWERSMLKRMPEEKDADVIKALGIIKENGSVDKDAAAEYAAGMFEQKESISVSVAEIVKFATDFELNSELLKDRLIFSKADLEKFLIYSTNG
jgi:hypothetical protein